MGEQPGQGEELEMLVVMGEGGAGGGNGKPFAMVEFKTRKRFNDTASCKE